MSNTKFNRIYLNDVGDEAVWCDTPVSDDDVEYINTDLVLDVLKMTGLDAMGKLTELRMRVRGTWDGER